MKKRVQLSLEPDLIKAAKEVMAARKFSSLSEFTEALIREEWERRTGPILISGKKPIYPPHLPDSFELNEPIPGSAAKKGTVRKAEIAAALGQIVRAAKIEKDQK